MADTDVTRNLKHDINQKNEIRRDIEKRVKTVSQWKDRLESSKCFQKQNKYTTSIKRYVAEIERLRSKLNQMNEDLDKRIREAGEFSATEIDEFNSKIEQKVNEVESDDEPEKTKKRQGKVIEEVKNAQKRIAELKGEKELYKKIEKANKQLAGYIDEFERSIGRIIKLDNQLGKINRGSKPEKEEQTQEARDKFLFTQELKRIKREKAIYG